MPNNIINQFFALSKKYFKIYFGISISVFLFILFFQPFPTINSEFENKQLFIAGYGLIIFIVQVLTQIIFQTHLVNSESEGEENSLLNSIYFFSQVILTSMAFIFYIRYVGNTSITFNLTLRVIIISLSVPVTLHLKNTMAALRSKK